MGKDPNEKVRVIGGMVVIALVCITLMIASRCNEAEASSEIGGSYSVTYQKCQRTTVAWECGNCGKGCGKSTITWPKPNSSTTKRFKCSKCGKKNKVKLHGKKWPCD